MQPKRDGLVRPWLLLISLQFLLRRDTAHLVVADATANEAAKNIPEEHPRRRTSQEEHPRDSPRVYRFQNTASIGRVVSGNWKTRRLSLASSPENTQAVPGFFPGGTKTEAN